MDSSYVSGCPVLNVSASYVSLNLYYISLLHLESIQMYRPFCMRYCQSSALRKTPVYLERVDATMLRYNLHV